MAARCELLIIEARASGGTYSDRGDDVCTWRTDRKRLAALLIAGKARTDVYAYKGRPPRFSDPSVGELWSNHLHGTMVLGAPQSMI
jgi:hypothetical protein